MKFKEVGGEKGRPLFWSAYPYSIYQFEFNFRAYCLDKAVSPLQYKTLKEAIQACIDHYYKKEN